MALAPIRQMDYRTQDPVSYTAGIAPKPLPTVSQRKHRATTGAVILALQSYEQRVIALEAVIGRGFLGRLRWLVLGR